MMKNPGKVTSFEDILDLCGTKGKKNFLIFYAACIGCLITSMHTFSYQFLGATPDHWCKVAELENTTWTVEEIKDIAIPYEKKSGGGRRYKKCVMNDLNYQDLSALTYKEAKNELEQTTFSRNNDTLKCSSRVFEDHVETVVNKWDLVCDRRALYSTTQAAIQGGMLCGALAFGYLIDRFGRFYMYKICVILYLIGGFATALSPNIETFIFLKMVSAMLGHGFYMAGFVLSMEFCSVKQRSYISNYYVIPWAFGIMLTPAFAYLVPTWYWLEVALTVPGLILIANFWILKESPRWLMLNQRYTDAADILMSLAKSNGKILPQKQELMKLMESLKLNENDARKSESNYKKLLDLIAKLFTLILDKKYRIRTFCIFFCWFSVSLVYYGVSLGSVTLSTNLYLYLFLGGVIEIPSYVFLWPAVVILGRRKTIILLFFTCAISILLAMTMILTFEYESYPTLKLILYLTGKFAITAAFHLIWVYTAELYPTNYRSLIVGEANAVGRVGSIFSPYINDILGEITIWAPAALFGGFSIAAMLLSISFPETTGKNLPDSLENSQKCKTTEKDVQDSEAAENPAYVEDESIKF